MKIKDYADLSDFSFLCDLCVLCGELFIEEAAFGS
jgi:hypothetical protein